MPSRIQSHSPSGGSIDPFIRLGDFVAISGLGRTTVYALIRKGVLPSPIKLGARACGFRRSTVEAFLEGQGGAANV
jgi:prophage regulatory protein